MNTVYLLRFSVLFFALLLGSNCWSQNTYLPDTVRSCKVDSLYLELPVGFSDYLWSNGDTERVTWIKQTGDYWGSVKSGDTLSITDYVFVNILDARIVDEDTLIICGDTIDLTGSSSQYDYHWSPVEEFTQSIEVYPRDTTMYHALISDPDLTYSYCLDSVLVDVDPIIFADTIIQSKTGCPDEEKAIVSIEVSGGYPPYEYDWSQGKPSTQDPSSAHSLKDGDLYITVTDTIGCLTVEYFEVEAYDLPELSLFSDPDSLAYLQKPYVTFSFENPQYDSLEVDTFRLTNWVWDFGDETSSSNTLSPTHTYRSPEKFNVTFTFNTFYGCTGVDSINIEIKPVKLKIPTVFTPNGDSYNPTFEIIEDAGDEIDQEPIYKLSEEDGPIDLSKYYISNTLVVVNRWGQKVFEAENYSNDWDGDDLVDGVYFYILKCVGEQSTDVYKGAVSILRTSSF